MKFSIKDYFSKCDQIWSVLRIWLYLLKKSLMENFIFWSQLIVLIFIDIEALFSFGTILGLTGSTWHIGTCFWKYILSSFSWVFKKINGGFRWFCHKSGCFWVVLARFRVFVQPIPSVRKKSLHLQSHLKVDSNTNVFLELLVKPVFRIVIICCFCDGIRCCTFVCLPPVSY